MQPTDPSRLSSAREQDCISEAAGYGSVKAHRARFVVAGAVASVGLLSAIVATLLAKPAPGTAIPSPVIASSLVPESRSGVASTVPAGEESAPPGASVPSRAARPPAATPARPATVRVAAQTAPPAPAETLLARLKDPSGAQVTFLREGTVRVSGESLSAELSRDLFRIYALERVPEVETGGEATEPPIRLTSPDPGNAGLEETAPVFRWTVVPGVTQYTLVLERFANAQSAEWQPVEGVSGQTVAGGEWVASPDARLVPGGRYRWRVEAVREGETLRSPTAWFRVLDENDRRHLDEARDRSGNIPFLLGPYYEALGLYEEATWEYLKLARANPTSPQAQRALENARLRSERHRRGQE